MRSRIKRSAMFCAVTACRPHRRASTRRPGRHSFGITIHPNEQWMQQMARNVTMEGCGTLRDCRYLLHDRDTKYTISFRAIIESGRVKTLPLPARSPNLNAYAERWVRSVKEECLSKIIVFGERSLRRALNRTTAPRYRNKDCCSEKQDQME